MSFCAFFRAMISKFALLAVVAVALPSLLIGAKTPPSPLDYQAPVYPQALKDSGKDGTVKITFTVSKKGLVKDPVIKSASEPEFGESALQALKEWRFRPGTENGEPIDMKVTLPFQFTASVEDKLNAALGRKVFNPITDPIVKTRKLDSKPVVSKRVRPVYPPSLAGTGAEERVKVEVVIGPDGLIYNPSIEVIQEKRFYLPVLLAAANWTFEPPLDNGVPVYTRFKMTVWIYEGEEPPGGYTGRVK